MPLVVQVLDLSVWDVYESRSERLNPDYVFISELYTKLRWGLPQACSPHDLLVLSHR